MSRKLDGQVEQARALGPWVQSMGRREVTFASSDHTLSPVSLPSLESYHSNYTQATSEPSARTGASQDSLHIANSESYANDLQAYDPRYTTVESEASQFYDNRGKVNWVKVNCYQPNNQVVEVGYVKGMVYEGHSGRQRLVLVLATVPLPMGKVSIGARVLQVKWKPERLEQTLSEMRVMVENRIYIGDFGDAVCDYAKEYLYTHKVHQLFSNVGGDPPPIPPTTYYNLQPEERYSTRARIGIIRNRAYLKSSHSISSSVEEPTSDAEHDPRSPVESIGDRTYKASDRSSIETAVSAKQSALPAVRPGQDICVIERHAQDYHDIRGKVTWISSPLHQDSEQNWAFGYIKGMHYRDSDTWVLILTALKVPVPIYVLDSRRTTAGDTVFTRQRNYHILLQIDGKTPGDPIARLENRMVELEKDLLGPYGAKITRIAQLSLGERINRLWKRIDGCVPEVHGGVELGPQRQGERVWKLK